MTRLVNLSAVTLSDKIQMKSEESAKQLFKFHRERTLLLLLGSLFAEIHYYVSHGAFGQGPVSTVQELRHKVWNVWKTYMDALVYRQDMTHAVSSKCYEPRSGFYAVRHLYQINSSGSPDGKLSNKAEMP